MKTLKGAKFFFFHLSLSPEVGVYKVGLIDESSANSLHLVRVWESGENVRKKKSVTWTERERCCASEAASTQKTGSTSRSEVFTAK